MTFVLLLFILICSFAIMNTVLAFIVQHTLSSAMDQRDDAMKKAQQELHRLAQQFSSMFHRADNDNSGMLSKEEFVEALGNKGTRRILQELDLGDDFACLDPEEIGMLFDVMIQMRGSARARRIFELRCQVAKMRLMLRDVKDDNTRNVESVKALEAKIGKGFAMLSAKIGTIATGAPCAQRGATPLIDTIG